MSGCLSGMDGWENAVGRIGYFARQTTFIPAFVFFFIFLLLSFPGFDLLVLVFFLSCLRLLSSLGHSSVHIRGMDRPAFHVLILARSKRRNEF